MVEDHGAVVRDPVEVAAPRPVTPERSVDVQATTDDGSGRPGSRPLSNLLLEVAGPLDLGEIQPLPEAGEVAEVEVGIDEPGENESPP